MGTIVKLVVAVLILNGVAQAGLAALDNYQFEDAVHQAMLFAPNASDADLVSQAAGIAAERGVPLTADDISITHRGADVIFSASYDVTIPLVPRVYSKVWTFTPTTSVRSLRAVPVPR